MTVQDNSSQTLIKNSAYSFLGYLLPIVFSIAITPVIVKKLGVQDYGIYVLLNTINGFLTLIDLGVGLSLVKYAAEYRATKQPDKLYYLIGSVNFLFLVFGLIGLLVYFLIGKFFLPLFNVPIEQSIHILPVFLIAGASFFITSLAIVPTSLLKAWQRYDLSVKIGLFYLMLFNLASLCLVLAGFKLKLIFLANAVLTFLAWLAYMFWARKATGQKLWHFDWNWQEVKRCYRFGIAAFVTNISNNTLSQLDRLVIPIYLSPAQLSYYSLPGNVAEKINGVTGTSTNVLFPMLSSLTAAGQKEQISRLYIKVFRNIIVLAAAMAISVALFSQKILFYWINSDFAEKGAAILIILAGTNALLAIYAVLQNFLLGFGKVRFLMKVSISMAILNVLLLILLVPPYGIRGAAWAYLFSVLPIFYVIYWVEKRILYLEHRSAFYMRLLFKLLITGTVFYAIYYLVLNPLVVNLASLIVAGLISVPLYLVLYKFFGFFDQEDWLIFKNFFKLALIKFGLLKPDYEPDRAKF